MKQRKNITTISSSITGTTKQGGRNCEEDSNNRDMSSRNQGHRDEYEHGHEKINTKEFYNEYHGHKVKHLNFLYPIMRRTSDRIIWTAGDSSLDNKFWFSDYKPAVPNSAYEHALQPPRSNADVTYWMNYLCSNNNTSSNHRKKWATMNTAGTLTKNGDQCEKCHVSSSREYPLWPHDSSPCGCGCV